MEALASLLVRNEILLLTLVVFAGLLLGRVSVFGTRLGPAGVLFAGLGLSAWLAPYGALHLASAIKELGLVLFVYCVGLSSAPGFFRAFRDRGARWNIAVLGVGADRALTLPTGRDMIRVVHASSAPPGGPSSKHVAPPRRATTPATRMASARRRCKKSTNAERTNHRIAPASEWHARARLETLVSPAPMPSH